LQKGKTDEGEREKQLKDWNDFVVKGYFVVNDNYYCLCGMSELGREYL
jgi:hypothetical protein